MNTSETNSNPDQKIDQQQIQAPQEEAPVIKTEENQANWKAFREQRELERKSRIEFEKKAAEKAEEAAALRAALEAITNKPSQQYQQEQFESEESEEQRIEKRVMQIIEERELKKEAEKQQREAAEYPKKLLRDFKDFNEVCSEENLDYLEYHYPEVTAPFKHVPEGYDRWAAIYAAAKRFVPNINSKADRLRADKNLSKPGSISIPGTTPQGSGMSAQRLDEARKAANWERMQKTLKGLSS